MLDFSKFDGFYTVKIQGIEKLVYEWNNENGIGDFLFSFECDWLNSSFDVSKENLHVVKDKILEFINSKNYSNYEESDFSICNNCISWNQIEDSDGNINNKGCYISEFSVIILINSIELTEEDLTKLFENSQH